MLKKHERKAAHHGVEQRIGELVGRAGILQLAEGGGQQLTYRF